MKICSAQRRTPLKEECLYFTNILRRYNQFCLFPHHRKDVRLPQQLQRAMAAEAEAAREARAKVIAAEGEHKSSRALAQAAEVIAQSPAALQVNSIVSDRR